MIDLKKIKRFAQEIHDKNNDGHGFDHIERVVALAQKILLTEPSANQELVLATCYLHDTYDEKLKMSFLVFFFDLADKKVHYFITLFA